MNVLSATLQMNAYQHTYAFQTTSLMFLMLSKTLFAALLAATVCGAASVVPRYEYESDRAGKANAPAVCVVGLFFLFTSGKV